MSKQPSDKTRLRVSQSLHKRTTAELVNALRDLGIYRQRATKAEQDAAEWKRRFDLLLAKCEIHKAGE